MDPALAIEAAALSKQQAMIEAMSGGESEVQRFYNNAAVFLTGGSGFIGKQLIEKLLRACQISKVFVLLRPKKGKRVQERLEEMLKDPVFQTLRQIKPNFTEIIIAIEGDVAEIRLGIKDQDWRTLTEEFLRRSNEDCFVDFKCIIRVFYPHRVDVIFHVAATTKFDETLRSATLINVRGTRETLLLGIDCKKLKSYVHVSTAYTHATTTLVGKKVEEEFYDAPVPPDTMISMAEDMDSDRLTSITNNFIKNWPNTYTFTKSISEELVRTMSAGLPICIVRPGIVLCTYREPLPGWLDLSCVYGASGLVFGAGLGIFHTCHTKFEIKPGLVPCDYVNNAIIAAGKETATNQANGGDDTRIYTVSSTQRNPITWAKLISVFNKEGRTLATPRAIYYNTGIQTSNKMLFMILSLLFHIIPAYIADFVCLLLGKQRRFVKIAKKAYRMCNTLSYFLLNEWQFTDSNLEKLYSTLSKEDKAIFNFDIPSINWTEFVLIWCVGVRKYLIKDGLKDTEYGVKKQKYLRVANYIIMALYFYGIWKLIYYVFYIGTSSCLGLKNKFL